MTKALIVGENTRTFEGNNLKILTECLYKAGFSESDYTLLTLDKLIWTQKTNLFIALGDIVTSALTGQKGIYKWRGSVLSPLCGKTKVIPCLSPTNIQKQWKFIHILTHDLKKCFDEKEFPETKQMERTYIINPSFDEAMSELERLQKEEYLSFDLETYMRSEIIRCIGLGSSIDKAICIPFVNKLTKVWDEKKEKTLWLEISKLLTNPNSKKVAQNAQFEMTQLEPFVSDQMIIWLDTMRAHALLYPEYPHNLGFLTSTFTDMNYYKDEGKFSPTEKYNFDELQYYNCKDVVATLEAGLKQVEQLKNQNLWEFYCFYDNPLMHTLWKMRMRGVKADVEKIRLRKEKATKEIELYTEQLTKRVGYELNVKSSKQMCKFLYEDLNLPKQYKKTKEGKKALTANEESIKTLLSKHPGLEELKLVLEIRKRRTIISTFLEMKLRKGRVHTSYGLTESGRLSSSQDEFGIGANMQNIPKHIRDIFIPDEGKCFIIADLSQAEARVVAWLAKDDNLKSVFLKGGDVHTSMASLVFDVLPSKVKKKQRNLAKKLRHAKNYGMSANAFAKEAGITLKDAKAIFREDDRLFPNVKGVFHTGVQRDLLNNRTLITPYGRKRTFLNRHGKQLLDEAYSYKPQGAVADYTNSGLLRLDYALPEGAEVLIQVHDEIVSQCNYNQVKEVVRIYKECVEKELYVEGDFLKIPLDVDIGENWKDGVAYDL